MSKRWPMKDWNPIPIDVVKHARAAARGKSLVTDEHGRINFIGLDERMGYYPLDGRPWIHGWNCLDCSWPFLFLFQNCFQGQMVPRGCQQCWKVVTELPDFAATCEMQEFQTSDLAESYVKDGGAKVGAEQRTYTRRKWGSYFYSTSKEMGLRKLDFLRKIFPQWKHFLKRGCTEFELAVGDSKDWKVTDEQNYLEDYLEDAVNWPKNKIIQQPIAEKEHILREVWIPWSRMVDREFSNYEREEDDAKLERVGDRAGSEQLGGAGEEDC